MYTRERVIDESAASSSREFKGPFRQEERKEREEEGKKGKSDWYSKSRRKAKEHFNIYPLMISHGDV